MTTFIGIWIDHEKAFLIRSNKLAEMSIERFGSAVEPHHKGGVQGDEHFTLADQKSHDERRHNQMREFSESLLPHFSDAEEILVFGPGVAKNEFKNVLEKNKALADKLKGTETADSMSENEMKAFVKDFFKLPRG